MGSKNVYQVFRLQIIFPPTDLTADDRIGQLNILANVRVPLNFRIGTKVKHS